MCAVFKQDLDAATAFAALSTIAIMREPMTLLGKSLSDLAAGAVAAHRLEGYLTGQSETRKWDILDRASGRIGLGGNATFRLDVADPDSFRLGPLDVDFPIGKLSLVCGAIVRGSIVTASNLTGRW